jgi:cbb3-type cytochrome oxidase subunit 3
MTEFLMQHAATIATVFFFLFFCYVVYAVFKKGTTQKFDKYSKIPLQENDESKK